ncbi:unnamed protein product [Didymodactylos carnosus]|uniref:Uncharacterized protein n=1 Tax=Didymodactylos carnosus TaxID=1234261 RepID=A0A815BBY2_9BILA|nr:unnamed protein product [Didymodactylos carnosus]CAF4052409.1 unnamed protein product [Didymodactylos carnosus]
MSATYADELAKYNNSEASLVTNTPNMDSFSPNSSQLSFLDDEEENTLAHDQLLTLTSVNNKVELVTVPPQLTTSVGDRIEIIPPPTSVNTNSTTSTSFHTRTGGITDETVRNNGNSVTTTTTVHISPISICAPVLSSRRWIDSEVQTDLTFETSTIEQDGSGKNIEGFRLYKEWWLTMDCKARVHNNKLCKRENCELNHRQEGYCRICNGKSRHMVTQTAFAAVEEEENVIGKYCNKYSRYYRFRNHLALNVYYRENNLFPKSLQIEVPKQNFGADDSKLKQQWLDIVINASKDLFKCEAQAIERTIAQAEAKCELLLDKLCEMTKEREMMEVEREESVKLKEDIESSWNKVFSLEMREISARKTRNEYESSDDVTSSIQNILWHNDLSNTQNVSLHAKLYRPRVSCFGCGKVRHIQSRCFGICSFCNGRKHSEEFCKKIKKVLNPCLTDSSCDPMVDELKRIVHTDD